MGRSIHNLYPLFRNNFIDMTLNKYNNTIRIRIRAITIDNSLPQVERCSTGLGNPSKPSTWTGETCISYLVSGMRPVRLTRWSVDGT